MAHPHGDGDSFYMARVTYPCLDHGHHTVFMASLDSTAHNLAMDIQAHHERIEQRVEIDLMRLPRSTVAPLFTDDLEDVDGLAF